MNKKKEYHDVFYYELNKKDLKTPEKPASPINTEIIRLKNPTVDFYRFLFHEVGSDFYWTSRKLLSDKDLLEKITDKNTEIYVIYQNKDVAGYLEIEWQKDEMELVFFGLRKKYIGKGLGKYFLNWAMHFIWTKNKTPIRLWLHTCEFDHKAARSIYESHGFKLYMKKREKINHIDL